MKNIQITFIFFAFMVLNFSAAFAQNTAFTSKTFIDAQRSNRSVATRIYYPSVSAGQNVPMFGTGQFPVVVFAHGFLMSPNDYAALAEQLVPQGYIIVQLGTETALFPSHTNFAADLNFMVDAMKTENTTSNSLFFNRLNGRFALGGHSMGGGASFLAAANNPNISALFNLAAANTTPSAIAAAANITCPTLIFAGQADCVTLPTTQQQPLYAATAAACKFYLEIAGASHCKYADAASICYLGEAGACSGTLSLAQQLNVTMTYLTPFLDTYLKNQTVRWTDFKTALTAATGLSAQQSTMTCTPTIPVELTHFSAKIADNGVQLDWKTASEQGNKGFDIERGNAINGILAYEKLGFIKGNETTSEPHFFTFLDTKPLSTTAYYRLKQWDINGDFTFSKTIAVSKKGDRELKIAPNPVGHQGMIRLYDENVANKHIETDLENHKGLIMNTMGQVIKEINSPIGDIYVGDFPKGIYFLKLKTKDGEQVLKSVK